MVKFLAFVLLGALFVTFGPRDEYGARPIWYWVLLFFSGVVVGVTIEVLMSRREEKRRQLLSKTRKQQEEE